MLPVTDDTIANAKKRAFERRAKVRLVRPDTFDVRCDKGHTHRVRFALIGPDLELFAECFDPETGEVCPSELGHRLCYHVADALALRDGIDDMRAAAVRSRTRYDRDGLTEIAVLNDGPLPGREEWDGCFYEYRPARMPEPEGNPEAVLVSRPVRGEKVGPFQI